MRFARLSPLLLMACTEPVFRDGEISEFAPVRQSRGIEARFDAPGVAFRRAAGLDDERADDVVLRFVGWGNDEGDWRSVGAVDPAVNGTEITYDFDDVVEWWRQEPGGLRQGWTVRDLPAGEAELAFEVAVEGASVVLDERGALIEGEGGRFRYGLPVAWDANGVELPAWLEESEGGVRVMVDVEGAVLPITVDPLVEEAVWEVSAAYGSGLGSAIASAGDVNGDGYDDVIVGDVTDSTNGYYSGVAYVFLSSSGGLSLTADWTYNGDQATALLGEAVAGAGDVNGDGFDDVIVGAYGELLDSGAYGAAYLFLGSAAGLSSAPDWAVEGETAPCTALGTPDGSTQFGKSVASAGDVNDDGFADVVVGAPRYCHRNREGRAYVFMGSAAGLSTTAAWEVSPNDDNAYFGVDVAAAGDVNADGYADVIVGAETLQSWASGYTHQVYGKAFVYHGSAAGLSTTASWTAISSMPTFTGYAGYFGGSVAAAGDLNGDGCDDVVVGESGYANGESQEGRVYAYLGSSSGLSTTAVWSPESNVTNAYYGSSVSGAGDINLDGYADIVVGSAQGASLYLGDSTGVVGPTDWDSGFDDVYEVGSGDFNADGFGDVVVGGRDTSYVTKVAVYTGYGDMCFVDLDGDGDGSSATIPADSTGCTNPGESANGTDCDDTNASINTVATEILADGIDNDCDGFELCYNGNDADADGHFADTTTLSADLDCLDVGESTTGDDCNDSNAGISPSDAEIVADTLDQDCDGFDNCYADTDADSYGSTSLVVTADFDCADAGESWVNTDCDDGSAAIRPGGSETAADGIDGDCNGGDLCYVDADRDSTGSTYTITSVDMDCGASGESALSTDCDDGQPSIYPGAPEVIADTVDQDCDTHEMCYLDNDRDGYGSTDGTLSVDLDCDDVFEASAADDCDDANDDIHPGASEAPADNIDGNCDNGDLCFADTDGDGFGTASTVGSTDMDCNGTGESALATDCDDTSNTIYPNASETTADGVDQDCDAGDTCYEDQDRDGFGTAATIGSIDLDCSDIYESSLSSDCDDLTATVSPAAAEVTADAVDQDCDGGDVCFVDVDGDTFGSADTVASADLDCAGSGESPTDADCDDSSSAVSPAASEQSANGIDDDCDTLEACYADNDGDGYGTAALVESTDLSCSDAGLSTANTDCNDADPTFSPGVEEVPADGIDQNCDGSDACYVDGDADGYGIESTTPGDLACTGSALVATDCDDVDGSVHPGAAEVLADSTDQDCDGAELCFTDGDHDGYGDTAATTQSTDLDCADLGEAAVAGDCNDNSVRVRPLASETPGNGVDEDCDGSELCYVDADGDGAGTDAVAAGELTCTVANDDCDDTDASTTPGAAEICNGRDDNCDGRVDEALRCAGDSPLLGCATTGGANAGIPAMLLGIAAMLGRRRLTRLR